MAAADVAAALLFCKHVVTSCCYNVFVAQCCVTSSFDVIGWRPIQWLPEASWSVPVGGAPWKSKQPNGSLQFVWRLPGKEDMPILSAFLGVIVFTLQFTQPLNKNTTIIQSLPTVWYRGWPCLKFSPYDRSPSLKSKLLLNFGKHFSGSTTACRMDWAVN